MSRLRLAIAERLAEVAGGEIWYEPNRPRGRLLLPAARLPQPRVRMTGRRAKTAA